MSIINDGCNTTMHGSCMTFVNGRKIELNGGSISVTDQHAKITLSNGQRVKIPLTFKSLSVTKNTIYVNGRKYEEDGVTVPSKTIAFLISTKEGGGLDEIPKEFSIKGVDHLDIKHGDEFELRASVQVTDESVVLFNGSSFDATHESVEACEEATLTLPPDVELNLDVNADSVHISRVSSEKLELGIQVVSEVFINLLTCEKLEAATSSGKIKAENLTCQNLRANTQSGSVSLRTATMRHCDAQTMGGSVHLAKVNSKLYVRTMSGSVNVNGGDCSGKISTTSGSVNINNVTDPRRLAVNTMSGSLSGSGVNKPSFNTMNGRNNYEIE